MRPLLCSSAAVDIYVSHLAFLGLDTLLRYPQRVRTCGAVPADGSDCFQDRGLHRKGGTSPGPRPALTNVGGHADEWPLMTVELGSPTVSCVCVRLYVQYLAHIHIRSSVLWHRPAGGCVDVGTYIHTTLSNL